MSRIAPAKTIQICDIEMTGESTGAARSTHFRADSIRFRFGFA